MTLKFKAEIIADSISEAGKRITTFELCYPRFIHSEMMTHRVFSRNASSSRAIPFRRLIDEMISSVAMPVHWGKNQPGMQAEAEHDAEVMAIAILHASEAYGEGQPVPPESEWKYSIVQDMMSPQEAWNMAAHNASIVANRFAEAGYHKQIVNRLIEPFLFIKVVVTTTELDNFFELRCHGAAQPEIHLIADMMRAAYDASEPTVMLPGEWHLPYIDVQTEADVMDFLWKGRSHIDPPSDEEFMLALRKVSAARCARTSYMTFDGKRSTYDKDLELCEKLIGDRPLHASPFEHQATPDEQRTIRWCEVFKDGSESPFETRVEWRHPEDHRNLVGWRQSRAFFERDVLAA